jgi:hypothetical protein
MTCVAGSRNRRSSHFQETTNDPRLLIAATREHTATTGAAVCLY